MFAKLLLMILMFRESREHFVELNIPARAPWKLLLLQVKFIIGFQEQGAPQVSHEVGLIIHILFHPIWQQPPEIVFESQYEGVFKISTSEVPRTPNIFQKLHTLSLCLCVISKSFLNLFMFFSM